jgi:hypothetical protein
MLVEILKRTPPLVFVLFFALLALGYLQSKARVVKRSHLAILPAAMIALSFYGVLSAFGVDAIALAAWLIGTSAAVWLGIALAVPRGAVYSAKTLSFSIPGSWLPLVLMMAIYFTKYAVGVILAQRLSVADSFEFIVLVSLAYGFLSGLFLARALVIWRCAKPDLHRRTIDKQ